MAIGIPDVLFYWDAARVIASPTIGGAPFFSRAGNAFDKMIEALHVEILGDTPRFEPDGLRLELAQENKVLSPFNVDPADANWTEVGNFTTVNVTSLFEGKIAKKHTNPNDAANKYLPQVLTTLTSNPETNYAIIENVDSVKSSIALVDLTAGLVVVRIDFTWATEVTTLDLVDAGSLETFGAIKISDVGPNGGPVFLIWSTVTPNTSGNSRQIRVHPSGRDQNNKTAIIHAAQHVEAGLFTSAVDGTRPTELFFWEDGPGPQAWVLYYKFKALAPNGGFFVLISQNDNTSNNRWELQVTSNAIKLLLWDNSDNNVSANAAVTFVPGDGLELIVIFNANGSGRIIVRKNDGNVSAAAMSAPAGGLPTAWDEPKLSLNSRSDGSSKWASQPQKVKIVTQANVVSALDGSGAGDEDIMAEMDGLIVSADASRVSNTV